MQSRFYILGLFFIFLASCASPTQSLQERDAQIKAIREKLESYSMTKREAACDGCLYEMQEAVYREVSKADSERVGITRAKSGVQAFYFDNICLECAFEILLDSNFLADRFERDGKIALLNALASGQNDLNYEDKFDEIGQNAYAQISFAKRMKNTNQPKIQIDSVNNMNKYDREYMYADTLEGYVVGSEIVILHFYGGAQSWRR